MRKIFLFISILLTVIILGCSSVPKVDENTQKFADLYNSVVLKSAIYNHQARDAKKQIKNAKYKNLAMMDWHSLQDGERTCDRMLLELSKKSFFKKAQDAKLLVSKEEALSKSQKRLLNDYKEISEKLGGNAGKIKLKSELDRLDSKNNTQNKKAAVTDGKSGKQDNDVIVGQSTKVEARESVTLKDYAYIKGNEVDIRVGAGDEYRSLGVFFNGDKVNVIGWDNDSKGNKWYRVSYMNPQVGKIEGYVNGNNLSAKPTILKSVANYKYAYIKGNEVDVRIGAGDEYRSLGVFFNGDKVNVIGWDNDSKGNKWYRVSYMNPQAGKIVGYVKANYLNLP